MLALEIHQWHDLHCFFCSHIGTMFLLSFNKKMVTEPEVYSFKYYAFNENC